MVGVLGVNGLAKDPELTPGDGLAKPKSISFGPFFVSMMFPGLRSRCTMPRLCALSSASAISLPIFSASASGSARAIDGITARMLTVTLRGLECDGIVTRTIHPVIPPRVEYALTPMGRTLLDTIGQLVTWTDSHLPDIEAARAAYDARHAAP